MKDIDTEDTRIGTAFTFTGRGARHGSAGRRLAAMLPGLAAMALLVVAAAYLMTRPPGSPVLPPAPRDVVNVAPDISAPSRSAPRWPLPSPPLIPPLPRAGESGNTIASPDRSVGTQQGPAPRTRAAGPVGTAPASRRASAQPAAGAPAPTAPSRFHVQAGAFSEHDSAASLLMRLKGRGYAATLVAGKLYRVWVGGYLDRATAESLASSLRADGFEATLTAR